MKKTLSIILSIVMLLCSIISTDLLVFASGWIDKCKNAELDTWYVESASKSDYYNPNTNCYSDSFKFTVPISGEVTFMIREQDEKYTYVYRDTHVYVYHSSDLTNSVYRKLLNTDGYDELNDCYYCNCPINLDAGTYYLRISYNGNYMNSLSGPYDFCLNYKPNIAATSGFKVSKRGSSSLSLTWNKVANISGYQLQKKSGKKYKTVKKTTSTKATISNLSPAKTYKFRIRAYKTIGSKKYYGSWKYLTTPTKPGKLSIKTPSTNSNHQIIVKWKKGTGANGYQVQFARNKSCSDVIATKTVSGGSKTSYTGNNFTRGRTYYVRVRAYKSYKGKSCYGSWSDVKSIVSE